MPVARESGPGQLRLFKLPPWGRGGSLSGTQSSLSALPEGMIPLAVVTLVDSDYVEIDSLTWCPTEACRCSRC